MMIYNEKVETLFFDTQHAGVLDCTEPLTVCSRLSLDKNKCSELYLSCDEKGVITRLSFKALGDPYLLAGFEWLCREVENTKLDAHPSVDYSTIVAALSIPKINYAAAVLVETNYRQAITLLRQAFSGEKS